jgi:hypothetical protein
METLQGKTVKYSWAYIHRYHLGYKCQTSAEFQSLNESLRATRFIVMFDDNIGDTIAVRYLSKPDSNLYPMYRNDAEVVN